MLQPGLVLKSGVFSQGKTVNSIKDQKKFNPFQQINITNQPSGYNHILIKTPKDLVNLFLDIYDYHLYYNSYHEKLEMYNLYATVIENYKKYQFDELFPNAKNLVKSGSKWKDFKTRIGIYFGNILTCNLSPHQCQLEMKFIESYFKKREKYIETYGEDLLLDYFFVISLDELHLYFGARNFKTNFADGNEFLMDLVAFPVKLNTRIEGIMQNVHGLDVVFRRQASVYKKHTTKLFGLIQRTEEFEVKNPENPQYDESEITSSSSRLNTYKLFKTPKIQYYRKHLISPYDDPIYQRGMLFKHIKYMSESFIKQQEKHKKQSKEQLNEIAQK